MLITSVDLRKANSKMASNRQMKRMDFLHPSIDSGNRLGVSNSALHQRCMISFRCCFHSSLLLEWLDI